MGNTVGKITAPSGEENTAARKSIRKRSRVVLDASVLNEQEMQSLQMTRKISHTHESLVYYDNVDNKKAPTCEDIPRVTVKIDSHFYNMSHPRRGEALIFSHTIYDKRNLRPRHGSEYDEANLKRTLEKLKFKVRIFRDYTLSELRRTLDDAAAENYENADCLLVVVMSHGTDNKIWAKDAAYNVDDLWTPFTGKSNSLIGKPKLFFLQACRGTDISTGFFVRTDGPGDATPAALDEDQHVYTIPAMADVFVMYATAQGFVAFRKENEGSIFIKAICEELDENSNTLHLEDMMLNVKRKLALTFSFDSEQSTIVMKQIPQLNSTLIRYIFFGDKLKIYGPLEYAEENFKSAESTGCSRCCWR